METRGLRVESPPPLLFVIHISIPRSSDKCEQDSGAVRARNMQIEHEHSEQDCQNLFDICYKDPASVSRKHGSHESVKRTGHSHAQRPCLLIRGETDDVQPKGDTPVHEQSGRAEPSHLMRAPIPDVPQLPTDPRIKHTLDKRQRTHPSQQV